MNHFWSKLHVFMDEADAGEGGGGGGSELPPDGAGATDNGTIQSGSVLAGAGQEHAPAIPEKYQVKKEDGSLDIEASSLKLSEAYSHLEKRMGSGDLPPKTAEEYEITVPDSLKDVISNPKEDPLLGAFLKDAHASGLTQKQVDFVMGKYFDIVPQLAGESKKLSNDECVADLRNEWKTDDQYKAEVSKAFKAAQAYGGSDTEALLNEYGNDPRVIRLLARVGGELGEDSSLNPGGTIQGGQTVEQLMMSEAYSNPKHADHARVSAQVKAYHDNLAAKAARSGNTPLM